MSDEANVDALPANAPRRRRWTSVPQTIVLLILTAYASLLLTRVVPGFEPMFRDFGVKLPAFTQVLLDVSRWYSRGYGWIVVWLVPFVVPVLVTRLSERLKMTTEHKVRLMLALSVLVLGLTVLFIVTWLALMLPMTALMRAVSGPQ